MLEYEQKGSWSMHEKMNTAKSNIFAEKKSKASREGSGC